MDPQQRARNKRCFEVLFFLYFRYFCNIALSVDFFDPIMFSDNWAETNLTVVKEKLDAISGELCTHLEYFDEIVLYQRRRYILSSTAALEIGISEPKRTTWNFISNYTSGGLFGQDTTYKIFFFY